MVLAQAGLCMLVGMAGGWGQGCSHKAPQARKEQEMAENIHSHKISPLGSGLGKGSREGIHGHRAPRAVIKAQLL